MDQEEELTTSSHWLHKAPASGDKLFLAGGAGPQDSNVFFIGSAVYRAL